MIEIHLFRLFIVSLKFDSNSIQSNQNQNVIIHWNVSIAVSVIVLYISVCINKTSYRSVVMKNVKIIMKIQWTLSIVNFEKQKEQINFFQELDSQEDNNRRVFRFDLYVFVKTQLKNHKCCKILKCICSNWANLPIKLIFEFINFILFTITTI